MKGSDVQLSDFVFTDDFRQCMSSEYAGYCPHILCLSGAARFTVGDTIYNVIGGDAIIEPSGKAISNYHPSDDFRISALLISMRYLGANVPDSSYNIIGNLSMHQNPVLPMRPDELEQCRHNFEEIRRRLSQPYHNFYADVLRRAVEMMIFDFYDIHARWQQKPVEGLSQASRILQRFVGLLQEGHFRQERSVEYYADRLCITPKYLSEMCVAASGHNASHWIEQFTVEELTRLLADKHLPLTEIAYRMNFSSPAYLSRYIRRTLGMSPSDYRKGMG